MKHGVGILICSGLFLSTGAQAVMKDATASDNPYQSIIERNVFGLKPPPPPNLDTNPPAPPPSNVKLTGITTILGNKRALFLAQESQPGKAAAQVSYILTEGQREGPIEVLEIDDKAGSVKIKNTGVPQTLSFDKDGVKLPNTPPTTTPVANVTPTPFGATPNSFTPSAPGGGVTTFGAGGSQVANTTTAGSSLKQIPSRQLRLPPSTTAPEASITPEEQIIMMEVERERNKNNPNYPPLPITPLTPQPTPTPPSVHTPSGAPPLPPR